MPHPQIPPLPTAYEADSPQAAARVLILAMLSDGRLDPVEVKMLDEVDAYGRLGLSRAGFYAVLQQFCCELLAVQRQLPEGRLERQTLQPWFDAVRDLALRRRVCRLLFDVIRSDRRVHPAESMVFWQALDGWSLRVSDVIACRSAAPPAARPMRPMRRLFEAATAPLVRRAPRTFRLRRAVASA
jgi:hypothetical protein